MTFRDITNKNLKFHVRKFASFFLVNAFVVCVLFLFGSLLFNDILNKDPGIRSASSLIVMAAVGITVFGIIFLIYTGIYFIRSRGKEFGVYLTLGMTSRDLSRMTLLEGAIIFVASAILGVLIALIIGNLFYLVLAKVLNITENLFFINYKTFLFSLGILAFTFIIQRIVIARFVHNLSIIEITRSTKTKGIAKQRPIVGIMAFLFFIMSLIGFHAIINGAEWAKEFLRNNMELSIIIVIVTMLVSLFFFIGSAIAGVAWIFKLFPKLYQKNMLLISSLSHKFRAYRVSLFSVTLLITFAVFFIGIGMSFYSYGEMTIDSFQPFDFMIERRDNINVISEDELYKIINDAGGKIESINKLPYLDGMSYRELNDRDGLFINFRQNNFLVSESDFNHFTGKNIDLAADELLIVTNDEDAVKEITFNSVIIVEPYAQGIERADNFRANDLTKKEFLQTLNNISVLEYQQINTSIMFYPFINSKGSLEFIRSHANVVDDEVYSLLTSNQINELITINLSVGDHSLIMDKLVSTLAKKNNLSLDSWSEMSEFDLMDKDSITSLRPLSRTMQHEILLRANGFLLFAMIFLGLLFLISSCIVLYYKLAADTDEDAENISLLKKIGLTTKECRSYLHTHIAIVFFLPIFLGGALGLYLTYQFLSSGTSLYIGYLISRVSIMYGIIVIFGIWLYIVLRRRFFKDVNL